MTGDADVPRMALTGPAPEIAPRLLGAVLVSDLGARVTLRITEVEAYAGVGQDPGSHAHRRRTERNAAMFGPPGHAYVYFTYGMHWCLNVVVHPSDEAGAVLIRAGQVVEGIAVAHRRRPTARQDRDLARGPARLSAALGVSGVHDGIDLLDPTGPLRLRPPFDGAGPGAISTGPRTGVAGPGAPTSWRFWLEGDPTVSPHRPARPGTHAN
jgi:DNA-3-methyladenine glycosylase